MNDKTGNGANGSRDQLKLTCPCCGARVGLKADNGSARLELEEAGQALTFARRHDVHRHRMRT